MKSLATDPCAGSENYFLKSKKKKFLLGRIIYIQIFLGNLGLMNFKLDPKY